MPMVKKIFISYSHQDTSLKRKLMKQLEVLKLGGLCDPWDDRQIPTGTNWLEDIKNAIDTASVAVLMVSKGFLSSEFIMKTEVPLILERRNKGLLTVLPLFVNDCEWKTVDWLNEIQGFPANGKTLTDYNEAEQLELLTEFAGKVAKEIKTPDFTTTLFTPLPPRKIHLFGRENDLIALEDTLKTSDRVVLVNGWGGIGKTEVCKAFFLKHYEQYRYAAWVDWISSVKESIVNALGNDRSPFIQTSETDTTDDRFEKIKQKLCNIRESFLLVLDNIENPNDPDLDLFTSLHASIKVLANSRFHIDGYKVRNLDVLTPSDCKALFVEFYKGKGDDDLVEKVLALCGYHTLTVELLAKTAYHGAMSLGDLYQILQSKGFNLNPVRGEKVSTFWHDEKEKKTFFDHLVKVFAISSVTKKELKVLVNLSVLPSVYIPILWIAEWLKLKDNSEISSLIGKGCLKRDDEFRIYMHPVIQEVVKHKTTPGARKCKELIWSLAWKLKGELNENPIHKKDYLIYGESVVRGMGKDEKDEYLAALANNVSTIYWAMGQLDLALEFQLKSIEIKKAVLHPQHPDLALSYSNLSLIYRAMGQLSRALECQLKTNKILEAVVDPRHPHLAGSYHILSLIYKSMGQLDRALECQLKAIEIFKAVLAPQHPWLATSYGNISIIYQSMGQLDLALEFQMNAIGISEKILDFRHPDLATSYGNISIIYQSMGQLDLALEFQLKAFEIREAVLGPRHADQAHSYNNLSIIYQSMGQLDRALEYQLKAIEIKESILDPRHPDLATSYNNASFIYQDLGQWNDALSFAEKAVDVMQSLFPGGHPDLDKMKINLEFIKNEMQKQ
ncbi:MAG: tetratricopeptide repeat protein [Candidatus Omnitrophota bacterium]